MVKDSGALLSMFNILHFHRALETLRRAWLTPLSYNTFSFFLTGDVVATNKSRMLFLSVFAPEIIYVDGVRACTSHKANDWKISYLICQEYCRVV